MKNILDYSAHKLLEGRSYPVSIDKIFASKSTMRVGTNDMISKQYSHTPGSISVWKTESGELHVVDGYHRLWEALLIGKKWLMVTTVGVGYSPEWRLAEGESKFQCNSALRFGGLEYVVSSVNKLERMYEIYLQDKGESVLNFEQEMPKRKVAVRKTVDKLANVRNMLYTFNSIRMSPDLVKFSDFLKLLKKYIVVLDKKTVQQAVDAIVEKDNASFFVKLDEMAEWGFLFKKYVNKTIYDKGLKADQFVIANFNDIWLSRLVNSEAR